MILSDELPPHLQKQVDYNMPGTDILHGELKNLMLEAENMMLTRSNPNHKKYWEGQLDSLTHVYQLTYLLTFAIDDRRKNEAR